MSHGAETLLAGAAAPTTSPRFLLMPDVDLSSAARFLDALAGTPASPHTFIVFPEGDADVYPKIRHGTLAELGDLLMRANADGGGVSVTVGLTDGQGRTIGNLLEPRALFLDIDPPRDGDGTGVPLPNFGRTHWPSAIVRTARGWHAYWWLQSGVLWAEWEVMQLALARRFAGDEGMWDRTKALRVPGFWHHKLSPATLVELRHLAEEPRYTLADLAEAFHVDVQRELERMASMREPERAPRARPARYDPARVSQPDRVTQYAAWVDEQPPAVEGREGHKALVRVIKMAWNFGIEDWEDAYPVIEAFNDRCDPPWKDRELRTQFRSATRGRYDPTSWESMVWVPEPDVIRRQGPEPDLQETPLREPGEGVRKTITVTREAAPEAPLPFEEGPPHPADRPEAGSGSTRRARDRSAGRGGGGEGGDGGGGDDGDGGEELDWAGPPVNGHRVLDPEAPLESARMFVRWRCTAGAVKTIGAWRRGWYRWDGLRYKNLSTARINKTIYAFASPAQKWCTARNGRRYLAAFNPDDKKVNKIRHALESLTYLDDALTPPCWIEEPQMVDGRPLPQPPPKELVACKNGLLHLPSLRFLGPRPDYFNFTALGVDYDPGAPRPARWLRLLEELWEDDRESQQLLQEWFGLCLSPDTSFHKALLIVGPPRSGKGTIARILNRLHGEHNSVAWPSLSDLVSRFGLQALLDKTVAIIPDMRVSSKIDTGLAVERVLQITGEDPMQVDRKNLDIIPGAKIPVRFMMMSNEPPRLPDVSGAFASRILALRIVESWLGREDLELEGKLRNELPGILLWAIEGWKRLTARGYFVQPRFAAEIVEDLAKLSSPIKAFVAERCDLADPDSSSFTDDLFAAWRRWCEQEGRSAVGEKSTFVRNLRSAFPRLVQQRPRDERSGDRKRALQGIALLPSDDPPSFRRPYQQHL